MSSLIIEVCKIENIITLENADKLEMVQVKGWNCLVGKGQYKIGDLVVFVPPDSIIPNELIDRYELTYLRHGGRVGTTKLRGYISQGLILDLPNGKFKVKDDVTEILGITKYEHPEPKISITGRQISKKKLNSMFDKYTEIENINNYPDIFEQSDYIVITEKIHGSNFRAANLEIEISRNQPFFYCLKKMFEKYILKRKYEFIIGSHNVQLISDKNYYDKNIYRIIADKYDLKNKIPEGYILYGEIYGKGVQELTYGLDNIDLAIFDIKDQRGYISWDLVREFCLERDLKTPPVLYEGEWINDLYKIYTTGNSLLSSKSQIREGCVIKCIPEKYHPRIGRKILKSINPEYLLKKDRTDFH